MPEGLTPTQLFQSICDDISKRQLSNCQERDRAVLTMATAMLGISLTFIDKVVNIIEASHIWLLGSAWIGFIIAIVATLSSFHTSQSGLEKQLELARRYYLENDEDAIKQSNKGGNRGKTWTERLNSISSWAFVIAVLLLVGFIGINIIQRRSNVTQSPRTESRGINVPNLIAVPSANTNFGAAIPTIQPIAQSPQPTLPQGKSNGQSK